MELGHEYKIDVLAINELGKTWDEQQFSAKTAGKFRILFLGWHPRHFLRQFVIFISSTSQNVKIVVGTKWKKLTFSFTVGLSGF